MGRAAALALVALLAIPGPARAKAGSEGGCAQRRIGTVMQGAKLLSRCYALAARTNTPADTACIERADRRIRNSLERLDRAGCREDIDTQALLDATHAFVAQVTSLVADPQPPTAVAPSPAPSPANSPTVTPQP